MSSYRPAALPFDYGRNVDFKRRLRPLVRKWKAGRLGRSAKVAASRGGSSIAPNPRRPWQGGFNISRQGGTWKIEAGGTTGTALATQVEARTAGTLVILGTPEAVDTTRGLYNVPFAITFSLDGMSNYTDIANICDRYKLAKCSVKVWSPATNSTQYGYVYPQVGAVQQNPATLSTQSIPKVWWAEDYDDAVPMTVAQLKAKTGLKCGTISQGKVCNMSVVPVPAPQLATPTGGGSSYAVPSRPMFINTAFPTVNHYGIKGYLECMSLAIPIDGEGGGNTRGVLDMYLMEIKLSAVTRDLM